MKILQTKNEEYKEQLKKANEKAKLSKIRPIGLLRTGLADLNKTMDDSSSVYSVQTTQSSRRPNRRNQPRKTQMIFQDVKQKLAEMCMESEEIKKNMDGMVLNLKKNRGKRKSLGPDLSLNLGNESFLKTMDIHEIKEVEEDDEFLDDELIRDKAFSVQIKDEITNCKTKMEVYVQLIQEMTHEVERVDQENEILCDDIEAMNNKLEEYEEHMEKLQGECQEWTKKFLKVLSELEESKRVNEEKDEKLVESEKEIEKLKRRSISFGQGEEVMKDFKNLLEENNKLKIDLKEIEYQKDLAKREKDNLEENVNEVQDSYNNLNSILKKVVEKKDFFKKQIKKIEENHKIVDNELKETTNNEIEILKEKVTQLSNENRELTSEVKSLTIKNLELESEINFQKGNSLNSGLNSQLESSQMLLDMTYDAGVSDMYRDLEGVDKILIESHDQSFFEKKIGMTENHDQTFNSVLEGSYNNQVFEELGQTKERIEQLESEKITILRNKKDEINEIEDKLIQTQKDAKFEIEKVEKRFKHESKIWKKEKKKKSKEIKQLEKKLVQLKIQTSNLFVEKDALEMKLCKEIRLLKIKVSEYEKNIKEFNKISKTKDKKGFWDKMFN